MKTLTAYVIIAVGLLSVRASAITLETALDTTGAVWLTSGFIPTNNPLHTYDLIDAAWANAPGSWIETRIIGPGSITFRWYGEDGGWFTFYDNGNAVYTLNNAYVWQLKTYSFGTGEHALRWVNTHSSAVCDYGLDTVSFNGQETPIVVVTNYVFVTITNTHTYGTFPATVTVDKPVENAVVKAKAGKGITMKGTAITTALTPIISVQASADGGNTWNACIPSKKNTWTLKNVGTAASGPTPIQVRAVSSSNDVSASMSRTVTIQR